MADLLKPIQNEIVGLHQEISDLRSEMNERFDDLHSEMEEAWKDIESNEKRIRQHEREFHQAV